MTQLNEKTENITNLNPNPLGTLDFDNITSYIKTLEFVPTYKPKLLSEQVVLVSSGGSTSAYLYDTKPSELGWKRFGSATTYAGYVNSDGTAGSLPSGWSSSRRGAGQYTITHNLNSANYTCCCISYDTVAFPKLNAVNVNDAQPDFLDAAGNLTDARFYFILIPF